MFDFPVLHGCCCRGALFTALIVLYALTACIAGYVATSYYVQMEGQGWVQNILVTCFCYCGPFFCMFMFLNTVAIVYRVRVSMRWLYVMSPCWHIVVLRA
jgi:hypothetical protein